MMKRILQYRIRPVGFSIIEGLIALIILAVGLLALATFHGQALLSSGEAKARTQAAHLAQSKMDELRSIYTVAQFDATTDSGAAETGGTAGSDMAVSGLDFVENFARTWTATDEDIDADGDPDQKRIQVNVAWTDARNTTQTIALESVVERVDLLWAGRALTLGSGVVPSTTTTTASTATTSSTTTTNQPPTTTTSSTTTSTSSTTTAPTTTTTTAPGPCLFTESGDSCVLTSGPDFCAQCTATNSGNNCILDLPCPPPTTTTTSSTTTTTQPTTTTTSSTTTTTEPTTTTTSSTTTTTEPTTTTTTQPTTTTTTSSTTTSSTTTTTAPTTTTTTNPISYTCTCATGSNKNNPSLISGGGCCSLAGCQASNPKIKNHTWTYTCFQ